MKKPEQPSGDYDAYRGRQAKISRDRSQSGRDIGPLPEVEDKARREHCRLSLRAFCETYLAGKFQLAFSRDHLTVIQRLERCVLEGGRFALAMPRGSGKTTLAQAAATWAILYAHRSFVVVIGATETHAIEMLDEIKIELEVNELLAADFPAVCYPVRMLEGISNRANGQTLDGERTRIGWTNNELVLPTVAAEPTSGTVLRVAGLTGRIRGMKSTTADGRSIRPDLVIVDDPQTDESAHSPTQNAQREKILKGAVLGLAGPKKKSPRSCPAPSSHPETSPSGYLIASGTRFGTASAPSSSTPSPPHRTSGTNTPIFAAAE